MKKIDLHLHTVSTVSDPAFEFCMDTLSKYVSTSNIDCIAITNHNMFDVEQYQEVVKAVDCVVLPGIEIDVEGGHFLLIGESDELSDFDRKCNKITRMIPTANDFITVEDLKLVFGDLSDYLLIPHYMKDPVVEDVTLNKIKAEVVAGEVTSPKKFKYCLNNREKLTPVLFSDLRMKPGLKKFPSRCTYIDIGDISCRAIKSALADKDKVFLSKEDGHNIFEALDTGLKLSTGLNIVLGERSSGKSHTLNRLYDEHENVKYIAQFSLLEMNQDEDIKKFDASLSKQQSAVTKDHLKEIELLVEDVIPINLHSNDRSIEGYLDSLMKHASECEKNDAYSKVSIFSAAKFQIVGHDNLVKLIGAVEGLISNAEYRDIINKHLESAALRKLALDLIDEYNSKELSNRIKSEVNDLIDSVNGELRLHSASTSIKDIDLYNIYLDKVKVEKFNRIVMCAQKEREIFRKEIQGYSVIAKRRGFKSVKEVKDASGTKSSFKESYKKYDCAYEYLQELKKVETLSDADLHNLFVCVDYSILNKYGYPVSGGERSEFRLLQEINDSLQYDLLLIDEPESSFDNIFLMTKVNEIIKELAKNVPVVMVTHNSTVGASIKPDFIIHTRKEFTVSGAVSYNVYSGYPADKELIGLDGSRIKNHEALLNCLEAGELAYNARGDSYEILKG